jgi:hypothetical protein
MKPADLVAAFVAEALAAGRSRADIAEALERAGWTPSEARAALSAWAETEFLPPVPRPRAYVSAREAFVHALMFLALAVSVWNITALGFALIDLWLPEAGDYGAGWAVWDVRWSISVLVVVFPLFLVLDARERRSLAMDPARRRSAVRKWFGYTTLFLASLALVGDLVALIYAFLSGDLTSRVLAKAALVAVTAGLVFLYFRGEMAEAEDAR